MAAKTLLDRLNIAIENASNPKTQVRRKGSYMDYDDTEERVIAKKQIALLDAAKREKDRIKAEPSRKFAEEQAAADADPDVAAMEERGGMGGLDFSVMGEKGLSALRGKEYADEVKGIQEFTKGVVVKRRKADEDKAINKFAKEQAAADADPDVAAMEERGGMGGLDFSVMGEKGLSALRGKEYADEVKGQMEFDELDLGADFSKGLKPTGNALSVEPVEDAKAPTKPMGNVSTDLLSGGDIARRADVPEDTLAALFKKTHGGPFDPKSKMDKAKMATITSMIEENRDLLNLSPTQFALKVYARKK